MLEKLSQPDTRIKQLLDTYKLGQTDNSRLALLRRLFSNNTALPLLTVVQALFPDKELNDGLSNFRKFRDRVKKAAKQGNISLELDIENPKAELKERKVMVKGEVPLMDKVNEKVVKDLESNIDYLPVKYQVPSLSLPLKTITYPDEIKNFFTSNFNDDWQKLTEEAKDFITNLSIKLEPFTKVFPCEPESITMGFETLGISGNGQSFFQVIEECQRLGIPEEIPRITFFILSLCVAQDLRGWWTRRDGIRGADAIVFTINLDNELFSSEFLSPENSGKIFSRYLACQDKILLEVNEKINEDKIKRVIELCHTYNFSIALDDSEEMSNLVRRDLKAYAKMVKISKYTSQKLLKSLSNASPSDTIAELAKYRQNGKPFVIEGLERPEWIEFLRNNWKEEYGELYIQGYAVTCKEGFTKYLMPPNESGIKGAYIICNIPQPPTSPHHPSDRYEELLMKMGRNLEKDSLIEKIDRNLEKDSLIEKIDRNLEKDLLVEGKYSEGKWIPPILTTDAGDDNAIAFLEKWLTNYPQFPFCAVLGDLGMGKTFLCRMFTRHLLEKGTKLPIPLYLDLKFLDLPNEMQMPSLEEMIENTLKGQGIPGINGKDVLGLVHSGEVLLLIDSIDEKAVGFTPARALHFWQQIRRGVTLEGRDIAVKFKQRLALNDGQGIRPERESPLEEMQISSRFAGKVMIACRTHYFRDMDDADTQLTEARKAGFRRGDFQFAFLNSFTEEQILAYLKKCFGDKAEELWNTLKGIYNISDLAKRPFLLSLIEEHVREIIELKEKGVEITSASLYELAVKEWIRRDYLRHKIPGNMKAECMEDIALDLWKKQSQTEHIDTIDRWVEENILPGFPGISLDSLEQFKTDMRTATFLGWSEQGGAYGKGFFRFQHRSFQEFFIARRIASSLSSANPAPLAIPKISNEIAEFVLGLLKTPDSRGYNPEESKRTVRGSGFGVRGSYSTEESKKTIERILEEAYQPQISENALLLLLKWRELSPESSPLPQRFSLSNAQLPGFVFKSMIIQNSLFEHANLKGARFIDCDLSDASFVGANLSEARFTNLIANSLQAEQTNLQGSTWEGVQAEAASFQGADLTSSRFLNSKLMRANLKEANLRFATFTLTDLSGSNLNSSLLDGAGFLKCNLKETSASPEQFKDSILILPEDSAHLSSHQIKDLLPRVLAGHRYAVTSVAISPEAGLIASSSNDNTIKLWELKTGMLLNTLKGHEDSVYSVAISPEAGLIASGSKDNTIKLWELKTGMLLNTLKGHEDYVNSVAISSEAGLIASGSDDKTIKLWDLKTGMLLNTLKGHEDSVTSVAISPEAGIIASGSADKTIKLWELQTGRLLNTLKRHENPVFSVAISPEAGIIASSSNDNTIKLWELKTGMLLNTLKGHEDSVYSVAISPEAGLIASGSKDNTIKLWDLKTDRLLTTLKGHKSSVTSVAISPEAGLIASGSDDNTINLWELKTGRLLNILKGHKSSVYSIAISTEAGIIALGSGDSTIKLWELKTGRLLHTLKGHESSVYSVTISPEIIASGSHDKSIKLWELQTGRLLHTLKGHESSVYSVTISPEAGIIASGSRDKTIKLWELQTGMLLNTLKGHESYVTSVAISPEAGLIASGSLDNTIKLWEIKTGMLLNTLKGHEDYVNSVAISSEAGLIASGSDDKTIKLWDLKTGMLLNTLKGHEDSVTSVAISPEAGIIASGSADKTIKLWELQTGRLLHTLTGHENAVTSVAISPEAGLIASGSWDNTIKLWDLKTGEERLTIYPLPEGEWAVIRGDEIISGNADKYASLGVNLTNFPVRAKQEI